MRSDANSFLKTCEDTPLILDEPVDAKLRIYLHQQMNMIRHNFQGDDLGSILRRRLTNDLLTAFGDFAFEHLTTIFRTPNTVVFAAVDNSCCSTCSRVSQRLLYQTLLSNEIDFAICSLTPCLKAGACAHRELVILSVEAWASSACSPSHNWLV